MSSPILKEKKIQREGIGNDNNKQARPEQGNDIPEGQGKGTPEGPKGGKAPGKGSNDQKGPKAINGLAISEMQLKAKSACSAL